MEQFVRVTGIAVPMLRINIDTDQMVPGPELLRVRNEGHAASLFAGARYLKDREPNPEFILNREPWSRAEVLLADRNFGCGSSREAAPKALREYGFRALIAPSFGGIFFSNCFRNGLLPVELPIEAVRSIARQMEEAQGNARVTVDLEAQLVTAPDGTAYAFTAPATLRRMLLDGVDEIDMTLARGAEIAAWRASDSARRPWAY
ncbi:MAG: 3-isopropylmalate dehydratase small subunit [Alphaproteobacteria bacterium]